MTNFELHMVAQYAGVSLLVAAMDSPPKLRGCDQTWSNEAWRHLCLVVADAMEAAYLRALQGGWTPHVSRLKREWLAFKRTTRHVYQEWDESVKGVGFCYVDGKPVYVARLRSGPWLKFTAREQQVRRGL